MSRRPSTTVVVVVGVLVAVFLAAVVSYYASVSPDGLNRVAEDNGFASTEQTHAVEDGPLAGYGARGVDDQRLSGGVAGLVGSVTVLLLAGGLAMAVRRRGGSERSERSEREPVSGP